MCLLFLSVKEKKPVFFPFLKPQHARPPESSGGISPRGVDLQGFGCPAKIEGCVGEQGHSGIAQSRSGFDDERNQADRQRRNERQGKDDKLCTVIIVKSINVIDVRKTSHNEGDSNLGEFPPSSIFVI